VVISLELGADDLYMIDQTDAIASCHQSSLASLKSRMLYLSGASLPRLSSKRSREMSVLFGSGSHSCLL